MSDPHPHQVQRRSRLAAREPLHPYLAFEHSIEDPELLLGRTGAELSVFRPDGTDVSEGADDENGRRQDENEKVTRRKAASNPSKISSAADNVSSPQKSKQHTNGEKDVSEIANLAAETEEDSLAWIIHLKQLGAIWGQPISPSTRWVSWGRGTKQPLHIYVKKAPANISEVV